MQKQSWRTPQGKGTFVRTHVGSVLHHLSPETSSFKILFCKELALKQIQDITGLILKSTWQLKCFWVCLQPQNPISDLARCCPGVQVHNAIPLRSHYLLLNTYLAAGTLMRHILNHSGFPEVLLKSILEA